MDTSPSKILSSSSSSSENHLESPQPKSSRSPPARLSTTADLQYADADTPSYHLDESGIKLSLSAAPPSELPSDIKDIMIHGFTELGVKRRHGLVDLAEKLQPSMKKAKTFDPDYFREDIMGLIRETYLSEEEKQLLANTQFRSVKNRLQQIVRDMFKSFKEALRSHDRDLSDSVFLELSQPSSSQSSSNQAASQITASSSSGSCYEIEEEDDGSNDDENDDDASDDGGGIRSGVVSAKNSRIEGEQKKPPAKGKPFLKKRRDSQATIDERSSLVETFNNPSRELFSRFLSDDTTAASTTASATSNELDGLVDATALDEERAVIVDVMRKLLVKIEENNIENSIDQNKHPLLYAVGSKSKKGGLFIKCGVTAGLIIKFNSRCRGYHPGKQRLIRYDVVLLFNRYYLESGSDKIFVL